MTPCHVNIFWDPTLGFLSHNFAAPLPVPPIAPSFEMICMQMWTAGYATGQNKFTTTVTHRDGPIVLEGHDIGMMIPDITIPFVNIMYAINWPFSARKISFTASTVKMDKKMVGCAAIWPFLPMMTCGDPVSGPTAFPIANLTHTLTVGLTWQDIALGYAKIVVSMLIDAVFQWVIKAPAGPVEPVDLAMEFAKKSMPMNPHALLKKAVGVVAGEVFSFIEGKPKFELKIGVPGVAEIALTVTPGSVSVPVDIFGKNIGGGPKNAWFK